MEFQGGFFVYACSRSTHSSGLGGSNGKAPSEQCSKGAKIGKVAGPTRLELATSGVTGQRSNQLNYDPDIVWWAKQGSNL